MTEKDLIIQDLRRENAGLRARMPQRGIIMTNADHIRSMNDEMLDGFICSLLRCEFCKFGRRGGCDLLDWLQQPAEEDDHE